MKLRIIALVLCLAMLIPALVACTTTGNNGEDSKTDSGTKADDGKVTDKPTDSVTDAFEPDDIPTDLKINRTMTMLYWKEHTNMEFFPKEQQTNGDTINDALIARADALSERLGVDFNFVEQPGDSNSTRMAAYVERVEADRDGTKEYDIVACYSRVAPTLALRGLNAKLNELEYLDFSKPWWPDSLVSQVTVGNNLYFCSGDISTNLLWMMEATFYNMDLIKSYTDVEDPMQLVKKNEWTFDKFFEICEGKHESGATEMYGCVLYNTNIDAYQTAAGIFSVDNNDGTLSLGKEYGSVKISDFIDRMISFIQSDDVSYKNSTSIRDLFFNKQALFTTDRVFIIYGKDSSASAKNIDFDYGIVPNPKLTKNQNFYTNVGHPFTMYCIPSYISEDKQNESAATLECLASESHRNVTTPLFDVVMKARYTTDPMAREMFDIIRSSIVFEAGRIFNIDSYYASKHFTEVIISGKNTWKSDFGSHKTPMENAITEINTKLGGN